MIELDLDEVGDPPKCPLLEFRPCAGLAVDDAQRADGVPVRRPERGAGVEADVRVARDQRVVGEAGVGARVGHDEHVLLEDRVGAEGDVARGLRRRKALP